MRFWNLLIFLLPALTLFGQDPAYVFDVKDPTTFDVTCGKITGAYWGNIDDTCSLTTSPLILGSSCGDTNFVTVPVIVRINPSGNMECDDLAITEFYCEIGGWQTLDTIEGCTVTNNQTYYYNAPCANQDTFMIRVSFSNNDTTEKWQIRDGDIEIYDDCSLLPVEVRSFQLAENEKELTFKLALNEQLDDAPALQFSKDGQTFWDLKFPTHSAQGKDDYQYYWDMSNGIQRGYYRAEIHDENGRERHSAIIEYSNNKSSLLSIRVTDDGKLKVDGLEGVGKVIISTMSGNKVEGYEVDDDPGKDIIELPGQLQGIYIATVYSSHEHRSVKFVLR